MCVLRGVGAGKLTFAGRDEACAQKHGLGVEHAQRADGARVAGVVCVRRNAVACAWVRVTK